ncbi:MMPL family transporter [soil metagenome]
MIPARRILRILAVAGLVATVAVGLGKIRLDSDVLGLLPGRLPEVQGLRLFLDHFAQRDELIVAVEADDPDTAAAAAASIAAALQGAPGLARDVAWQNPWDDDPAASAELAAYLVFNGDPGRVQELAKSLAPGALATTLDAQVEALATGLDLQDVLLASYDPLGIARTALSGMAGGQDGPASEFASADGTFRIIQVRAPEMGGDYRRVISWVGEVREVLDAWRAAHPEFGTVAPALTGEPAFVAEISASMQGDMRLSGSLTLCIIGAVFFLAYRRIGPLLALLAALALTFVITLGLSGLMLGGLTVISIGFASILIGLTVDYGVILYQRALDGTPSTRALRRSAMPGIAWAALTTAAAFLALSASKLPGLSELGTLVGIGILVGAAVMLACFAPAAAGLARRNPTGRLAPNLPLWINPRAASASACLVAALLALAVAGLAVRGVPGFAQESETLRPRHSEAYDTLDRLYGALSQNPDSIQVIVRGQTAGAVNASLAELEEAVADAGIDDAMVPRSLWPDAARQSANRPLVAALAAREPALEAAVDEAGFTADAFALTRQIVRYWGRWAASEDLLPLWPQSAASERLLRRVAARDDTGFYALASVVPPPGTAIDRLTAIPGAFPVSWDLLNARLNTVVRDDLLKLLALLGCAVVVLVAFAFRTLRETVLTLLVVALDLLALLGAMAWLGLTWNFVNLGALLLVLGAGLDYSLHMLLALREEGGDLEAAGRRTGFALLVCAVSTIAGFGSLATASNLGLASLGILCALAMAANALVALFLLPWLAGIGRRTTSPSQFLA